MPFEEKMSGIKGESLVMQWNMVNRVDYVFESLHLGNNNTENNQLLYEKTQSVLIKGPRLASHFGNRSGFAVIDNSFRVTITNLQYSDEASYLLTVTLSGVPPAGDEVKITIVKVKGKHKEICFDRFSQKNVYGAFRLVYSNFY